MFFLTRWCCKRLGEFMYFWIYLLSILDDVFFICRMWTDALIIMVCICIYIYIYDVTCSWTTKPLVVFEDVELSLRRNKRKKQHDVLLSTFNALTTVIVVWKFCQRHRHWTSILSDLTMFQASTNIKTGHVAPTRCGQTRKTWGNQWDGYGMAHGWLRHYGTLCCRGLFTWQGWSRGMPKLQFDFFHLVL